MSGLFAFLIVASAFPSHAALPPAAQAPFNNGVVAAKQQEWEIALQSFGEARKAAPNAPEIYYNLGLTESKLPGRELRAIAWFGAYLSADPGAENAKDVWDFIAALRVKNEGNIRRLVKALESGVKDIPNDSLYLREQELADLWAGLGDIPDTERLVASAIADDPDSEHDVARREGSSYNGPLAIAHFNAGDLSGAQSYAARIPDPEERAHLDVTLAHIQLKSGDGAGARATLLIAAAAADAIPVRADDQNRKVMELSEVAIAQVKAGDLSSAETAILAAQKSAELTTVALWKGDAEMEIGSAQAAAGDIAGAQKTDALFSTDALLSETTSKALLEDAIEGAQRRSHATGTTVAAGLEVEPSDWTAMLDSAHFDDCVDDCGLNTALFLDLAGYLKFETQGDPGVSFYAIAHAAEKLIGARNITDDMLKCLADHRVCG